MASGYYRLPARSAAEGHVCLAGRAQPFHFADVTTQSRRFRIWTWLAAERLLPGDESHLLRQRLAGREQTAVIH